MTPRALERAAGSRANRQARRLPYVRQASSLPVSRASCPVLVPEACRARGRARSGAGDFGWLFSKEEATLE